MDGAGFHLYRERIQVKKMPSYVDQSRDPGTKTAVISPLIEIDGELDKKKQKKTS